jgi:Na+/pantothenate symporter
MIVSSAALSHDIYGIIRPGATDAQKMKVNKMVAVVLAVIPFVFALKPFAMVQFIVMLQSSLVSSFFFSIVVLGLNWKGATTAGAIASMLSGIATVALWYMLGKPFGINEVVPGVLVSMFTLIAVSLVTPKVPKECLEPFFPEK